MKVLVVDDQPDVGELLRMALVVEGIEVSLSASGAEALATLASGPAPDLIVLDIQMPVLDGWEVLRRIRERPETHDLPVVVCTVKAGQGDAQRGWEMGCDGYITKPFEMSRLIGEVRRVAGSAPVDREKTRRKALHDIERAVAASVASMSS